MKEDILKFRKLCDILIKERNYTVNKIIGEAKISWPTMNKLLKEPIDEIKIQASVLGLIQDFIKAHIQDIEYQGIKSDPIKEKEVEKKVEMMRKEIPPEYHPDFKLKETPEPRIKVKPEALERRKNELAERERRASRGELIDMLIQEKELLKSKIDAIDVLLKHYIS